MTPLNDLNRHKALALKPSTCKRDGETWQDVSQKLLVMIASIGFDPEYMPRTSPDHRGDQNVNSEYRGNSSPSTCGA